MATPQALHHSLLRPCVLHILRAAGYHATRPSVLDTLTDLAARYLHLLAQTAVKNGQVNETMPDISLTDVRMAMQELGALGPERAVEDQDYDGDEDTRGVDAFIEWAMGPVTKEIRRIALDSNEDYLSGLSLLYFTLIFAYSNQF